MPTINDTALREVLALARWVEAHGVRVAVIVVGAFLAMRAAQALKTVSVVPERTVETIKQDVEWAKEQTQ